MRKGRKEREEKERGKGEREKGKEEREGREEREEKERVYSNAHAEASIAPRSHRISTLVSSFSSNRASRRYVFSSVSIVCRMLSWKARTCSLDRSANLTPPLRD